MLVNPREPILLNSWRTVKTDEQGGTTQRSKLLKLQNYLKYCNQLPTVEKKECQLVTGLISTCMQCGCGGGWKI